METIKKYDIKRNKLVLNCWGIILSVLIISYIIEYFKGNRTLQYVGVFSLVLLLPYIIVYMYSIKKDFKKLSIRYMISAFYLLFYAFTMFTTVSDLSFIYIFPILSILVIYMDKILLIFDYGIALIINLLVICQNILNNNITSSDIVIYEQQIACIILCFIFMYKTCDVLTYSHAYMLKLDKEIDTDELTLAKNRHYLTKLIDKEFEENRSISLAVIDIDDFKGFNDTYGHNFGDLVLRRVSKILIDRTKYSSNLAVVRTGGDEFLIVGLDMTEIEMYNLCLSICEDTSKLILKYNSEFITVHLSIGVSNTIDDSCYTYKELYDEADAQLYVAKGNGKNSVVHKERLGVRDDI